LKKIVNSGKIDVVISDNCYGLWNRSVYSVFITHQLHINVPRAIKVAGPVINRLNKWLIRKYDECWVPDMEEEGGFAGELSHTAIQGSKISYLGILSRFNNFPVNSLVAETGKKKQLLIIISGPEKQRTIFEQIVRQQLALLPDNYLFDVIRGLPGHETQLPSGWHNHLHTYAMKKMIEDADYIICRAGYSTIMDLIALKRTAFLVPTPGQSEQEYLAAYLQSKDYFPFGRQIEFNLISAIDQLNHFHLNPAINTYATNREIGEAISKLSIKMAESEILRPS
jgi:UDP-N-acetylglucosamine:LPS N-acetylglucosamine transferase